MQQTSGIAQYMRLSSLSSEKGACCSLVGWSPAVLALGCVMAACIASAADAARDGADSAGVQQLIERLASPNSRPTWPPGTDNRGKPAYPADYDHAAQETVVRAWDALLERGVDAFPDLIGSLEDKRYSCTVRQNHWYNLSVRGVCYRILECKVNVCGRFMRREDQGRRVPSWIIADQGEEEDTSEAVKRWWAKHKQMTLRELQLEDVKWAIEYERRKGFEDKGEEDKIMSGLERLRSWLASSKEPIRVDRDGHFIGEGREAYPPVVPPNPVQKAKIDDPFAPR
jgi:hypothetical protein